MLIGSNEAYVKELSLLWKNVFGDEEGYINLFFESVYKKSKTFAHFEDGKIVSVLYLLCSDIKLSGEIFNGYYLYAAATDKSFRGRGLMGKLINEAKKYAENSGKAFISLVPANEHLYNYYEKLGFKTAMYKSFDEINCVNKESSEFAETGAVSYLEKRNEAFENSFLWQKDELSYALKCFYYLGAKAYVTPFCGMICSCNEPLVYELVCKKDDYEKALSAVSSAVENKSVKVFSPYGNEKIAFGMVCPTDE